MFQYHCLNPIAGVGLANFNENYQQTESLEGADAVLVRSAAMHGMELPKSLLAVARAGAGVNNIPLADCAEQGIVVFNTPGANANGVKELVLAGMLLASRDIAGGIEWVKSDKEDGDIAKTAEKQKKKFAGCEISGKKLGIIGLVPSASLWQMQPPILVWKYTDTIHTFLSMQHGTCPATFITSRTWKISTATVIISPSTCRFWTAPRA